MNDNGNDNGMSTGGIRVEVEVEAPMNGNGNANGNRRINWLGVIALGINAISAILLTIVVVALGRMASCAGDVLEEMGETNVQYHYPTD
jgi:hypothetical protein